MTFPYSRIGPVSYCPKDLRIKNSISFACLQQVRYVHETSVAYIGSKSFNIKSCMQVCRKEDYTITQTHGIIYDELCFFNAE